MAERKAAPSVFISVATLTMPTKEERERNKPKRGGNQRLYDLSKLDVGKSIAIIGRSAKNLTTTISQNNAAIWPALDKNGKQKTVPTKDATTGAITGSAPMTEKRVFFVEPCDPKTDPEHADCRIWRES